MTNGICGSKRMMVLSLVVLMALCVVLQPAFAAPTSTSEVTRADARDTKDADKDVGKESDRAKNARTVSFKDFDLVVPEAWAGQVELKQDKYEQWLEWNGWRMVTRLSDGADISGSTQYLGKLELPKGKKVQLRKGSDFMISAQVSDVHGRSVCFYVQEANEYLPQFWQRSEGECAEYRAMQARAAGMSADENPEAIAKALLQTLAKDVTLTGKEDLTAYTIDMGTYRFVVPEAWRDVVKWKSENSTARIMHGNDLLCILGKIEPSSLDDWVTHVGVLDEFTRTDGVKARIVSGQDGLITGELMLGEDSWPLLTMASASALRGNQNAGRSSDTDVEEFLSLQRDVGGAKEKDSDQKVAQACLRACLEAVEFKTAAGGARVSAERMAEFQRRRDEIDNLPNTDARFGGNMQQMREAAADRLTQMLGLANDMHAYLGGRGGVDTARLDAAASRVEIPEQPYSGNSYALNIISEKTNEASAMLDELFSLARAAM